MIKIPENVANNEKLLEKWKRIEENTIKKKKKRYKQRVRDLLDKHYDNKMISSIHHHNREIFDSFFDNNDKIKEISFKEKIIMIQGISSIFSSIKNARYYVSKSIDIFCLFSILVDLFYHIKEKLLDSVDIDVVLELIE